MAKKFKWRLDTVKKAKERFEDQWKKAFSDAKSSQHAEETILAELYSARLVQQNRLKKNQSGKLNPIELQASHAYISNLELKIAAQLEKVEAASQLAESHRAELVKAVQENKVLENLRTRDHEVFKKDERKREQAGTDETANRASHRQQQKDSET